MIKDKQNIIDQAPEENFWIVADKPEVRKELKKGEIGNIRLVQWLITKDYANKTDAFLVEKNESNKKLFGSAIVGSREKMTFLTVRPDDEEGQEKVRRLWGVNVTESFFTNKDFAEKYKGYDIWLLEKEKVIKYFSDSQIS